MIALCLCGHPADTCVHAPFRGMTYRAPPAVFTKIRDYPPCPVLLALSEHADHVMSVRSPHIARLVTRTGSPPQLAWQQEKEAS